MYFIYVTLLFLFSFLVNFSSIEALHIRNATLESLNLERNYWKTVDHLSITDGNISLVVGEFAKLTSISCLNLSSNGISKFEERSLSNLYKLSVLDLSRNNLTDVPSFKKDGLFLLDISGLLSFNKYLIKYYIKYYIILILCSISCIYIFYPKENEAMLCSKLYEFVRRKLNFANKDKTTCLSSSNFVWFNSTDKVPFSQLEVIERVILILEYN